MNKTVPVDGTTFRATHAQIDRLCWFHGGPQNCRSVQTLLRRLPCYGVGSSARSMDGCRRRPRAPTFGDARCEPTMIPVVGSGRLSAYADATCRRATRLSSAKRSSWGCSQLRYSPCRVAPQCAPHSAARTGRIHRELVMRMPPCRAVNAKPKLPCLLTSLSPRPAVRPERRDEAWLLEKNNSHRCPVP